MNSASKFVVVGLLCAFVIWGLVVNLQVTPALSNGQTVDKPANLLITSKVERVKSLAYDIYYPRQRRVQEYCNNHIGIDDELTEVNTDPKWLRDLWFDNLDHLLYCQLSKVGSSTWVAHLLK